MSDLLVLGRNPFSSLLNVDVDDDSAAWSRRRLVDVCCGFFPSRLLRSSPALRSRRKHADVPCLPLVSAYSTCYYSTCCPTCVDKDSHPRCVVLVFLLVLHLRAAMVARGLAGSAKRSKRRSRRAKDHSASSARGSRERRSGSTEWCSVRNRLRDHRASCL